MTKAPVERLHPPAEPDPLPMLPDDVIWSIHPAAVQDVTARFLRGCVEHGMQPPAPAGIHIEDGIATIHLRGILAPSSVVTFMCGGTSYTITQRQIAECLDRDDVEIIVLRIDSPGGSARMSDLMQAIIAARHQLPQVYAIIDGDALGAAYIVALSTAGIMATPQSRIGASGSMVMPEYWPLTLAGERDWGEPGSSAKADQAMAIVNDIADRQIDKIRPWLRSAMAAMVRESEALFPNSGEAVEDEVRRRLRTQVYSAEAAEALGIVDVIVDPCSCAANVREAISKLHGVQRARLGVTD